MLRTVRTLVFFHEIPHQELLEIPVTDRSWLRFIRLKGSSIPDVNKGECRIYLSDASTRQEDPESWKSVCFFYESCLESLLVLKVPVAEKSWRCWQSFLVHFRNRTVLMYRRERLRISGASYSCTLVFCVYQLRRTGVMVVDCHLFEITCMLRLPRLFENPSNSKVIAVSTCAFLIDIRNLSVPIYRREEDRF